MQHVVSCPKPISHSLCCRHKMKYGMTSFMKFLESSLVTWHYLVDRTVNRWMLLCCRMDRVIVGILVLIVAFIVQYMWQWYRTMTDEDGVALAVDAAEPVTHRDEPQLVSLQVATSIFWNSFKHHLSPWTGQPLILRGQATFREIISYIAVDCILRS